jgi:hypothetical protein
LDLNYADGLCARCVLTDRIAAMRTQADPEALSRLERFLDALGAGKKPWSTLNWLDYGAGAPILRDLLQGRLELSHATLDAAGRVGTYLRGAFVEHGALAPRAEHERLTGTIQRELDRLPAGEDRTNLHAYARWQVVHDLARRERPGAATASSQKYARTCLRVATDLLCWLHEQNLTLSDLRQRHLDEWVSGGRTTRTLRIRPFLAWASRGKLTPMLDAPIGYKPTAARPGDAERRLTILQGLLGDEHFDPRDRLAGALVLLFAQPITRLLRLTPDDVHTDRDVIRIRLGREPVELPDPLGRIAIQLATSPHGLATTAAAGRSQWLFPGLRLDAPLSAEHMRLRLARLGITARPDRTATLVDLCQRVPPAILADLLGISEHNAAYWTKLSGGEWARYAAERVPELT